MAVLEIEACEVWLVDKTFLSIILATHLFVITQTNIVSMGWILVSSSRLGIIPYSMSVHPLQE